MLTDKSKCVLMIIVMDVLIEEIKKEIILIKNNTKNQIQGSFNDFKNEIRHLQTNFGAEIEKIRIKLT